MNQQAGTQKLKRLMKNQTGSKTKKLGKLKVSSIFLSYLVTAAEGFMSPFRSPTPSGQGSKVCVWHIYPGRCPGLCYFALSGL